MTVDKLCKGEECEVYLVGVSGNRKFCPTCIKERAAATQKKLAQQRAGNNVYIKSMRPKVGIPRYLDDDSWLMG